MNFKGASAEQDVRFGNKNRKLLKSIQFPACFSQKVDFKKVQFKTIRPWIAKKVVEALGFEDDVVIEFAFGLLETETDPRQIQIKLTGFLEVKTPKFMEDLWNLLLSAQASPTGIPKEFLDSKMEDIRKKRELNDKLTAEIRVRRERDALERLENKQEVKSLPLGSGNDQPVEHGRPHVVQDKPFKFDAMPVHSRHEARHPRSRSRSRSRSGSRSRNLGSRGRDRDHDRDQKYMRSAGSTRDNRRTHGRSNSRHRSPRREMDLDSRRSFTEGNDGREPSTRSTHESRPSGDRGIRRDAGYDSSHRRYRDGIRDVDRHRHSASRERSRRNDRSRSRSVDRSRQRQSRDYSSSELSDSGKSSNGSRQHRRHKHKTGRSRVSKRESDGKHGRSPKRNRKPSHNHDGSISHPSFDSESAHSRSLSSRSLQPSSPVHHDKPKVGLS
ncbi:hypothetical protein BASA50_011377 [Batrachochytrium salamandrivorans]|uniref:PWI domain-containing protein n=1 Tax=Batrachochytrium salamandrivorans TaxID=1357716 RepID=A0ABQ8EVY4_9FUNG|nr:hypothetical protein BASA50_011377 [Batrachochytrium salamandrivorans]KAH6602203.1 hypothetical protein BASA61_001363 [Batrachochytrium salamandrivorans]